MKSVRMAQSVSVVALSFCLTGCFQLTVRHSSIEQGQVVGGPTESYTSSPDSNIIVMQQTDGVSPKVFLNLIADSDKELVGINYSAEKYNKDQEKYQYAGGCSKFAAHNESGTLVWEKHVELSQCDGKPIVLDLSGTNLFFPLKLTVKAVERNGTTRIIESKYLEFPRTLPLGGH